MSNTTTDEVRCVPGPVAGGVTVLSAREVPLGGPRAMTVRRTLPQHVKSLIGAWCFADHYGPDDVAETGGMRVPPHPHTGLQTVSWLFTGEIEHRDSLGSHAFVRPGELNLMTAGHGIAHSEVSTAGTSILHGVQLWVALPDAARDCPPAFEHYVPEPVELDGATLRVFLGELAGASSPVRTFTPLLGAEVVLAPGARVSVPVDPAFEHGVLVDAGPMTVAGHRVERSELAAQECGPGELVLGNPTARPARALILGGVPFGEQVLMWWNFVGRTHEEVAGFREQWQRELAEPEADGERRFGVVPGYEGAALPAPPLPAVRMRPRG
ncbi:pirin family protein [Nocardia stercoris]|uniref:Pirin family protein n=1 Tax=Nocardia stercoris TaxID=2483361 RepID=A0A3M2LF14_9NOCA|nr:pirin family protein [Nocardia stercoris]RMI33278.1 pirin family protein [Nocardia stercoris]